MRRRIDLSVADRVHAIGALSRLVGRMPELSEHLLPLVAALSLGQSGRGRKRCERPHQPARPKRSFDSYAGIADDGEVAADDARGEGRLRDLAMEEFSITRD